MPSPMLCQICENFEAAHLCFTCVNPAKGINNYGGVLICEACKLSHHNCGIFLLHQTTSLESTYKKKLLQGKIKAFQLATSMEFNNDIIAMNVQNIVNKARVEAARTFIHKELMEVYNLITTQLTAKEKELNREVEKNFQQLEQEAEQSRTKLKELKSCIDEKCDELLSKLSDESETPENIESKFETLESLAKTKFQIKKEDKIGPYVKLDRGTFVEDEVVAVRTFKVSQMDYYNSDQIFNNPTLLKEANVIEEGMEYTIPSTFLTRSMLSTRRAYMYLPHSLLVNTGLWLRDAIECYILRNFEMQQFHRIADHDLQDYNNHTVVLMKCRTPDYPHMMRCSFTLAENEDKAKVKKKQRGNATPEVFIHPVDHFDLPTKVLPLSKVSFYKMDAFLESLQPLALKVGFNATENTKGTFFPELVPNARKKILKLLESGKLMKILFKKSIVIGQSDPIGLWSVDVTIDDNNLAQLALEVEESEMDKPKTQLCKDIRLQRDDSVPVVREIVGESSKPSDESPPEVKESKPLSDGSASITAKLDQQNGLPSTPARVEVKVHRSAEEANGDVVVAFDCLDPCIQATYEETMYSQPVTNPNFAESSSKVATSQLHGGNTPQNVTNEVLQHLSGFQPRQSFPNSMPPVPGPFNSYPPAPFPSFPPQMNGPRPLHPTGGSPHQMDDPSRRTLSYLALIIFGEDSAEFQNSMYMEEPAPHIKRRLHEQIQKQQELWSMLGRELVQPLLEIEIKRFSALTEDFRRFGVPMNMFRLPMALGPQLHSFLERNPGLKTVLKIINHTVPSLPEQPPQQQTTQQTPPLDAPVQPVKDRGDSATSAMVGESVENTSDGRNQLPPYQHRHSQSYSSYQATISDHGDQELYGNDSSVKRSTSDGDLNKTSEQEQNLSSVSSEQGESFHTNTSTDGWIEEEDDVNVMMSSRLRGGDSQNYYEPGSNSHTANRCGDRGHVRSNGPMDDRKQQRQDPGRDGDRRSGNGNRHSEPRRLRTGGRGIGMIGNAKAVAR